MKNILLCNNAMEIGGVETVILNQIAAFRKKGYQVYVLSGNGVYASKIETLGGHFIEWDFPEEDEIKADKIQKIVNIIQEKQITEIHIHKYQCIPSVLPAALITHTPYFAYEHSWWDTKKYYTWHYPIYKTLFPIYFQNAYKIIAITPNTAKITKEEYHIPDEHYEIVHNGIDVHLYQNDQPREGEQLENILIVSRICEEKIPTILGGIDLFQKILEKYPMAKLCIVGDGDKKQVVTDYIEKKKLEKQVEMVGARSNIPDYLKQADLLLGVDRCVLEAMAMKVPAVITGYQGIKGLICEINMDQAIEENFSGNNMPSISLEQCMEQLESLKTNKKEIIEKNHQMIEDKLNCLKNYITVPENASRPFDWIALFQQIKQNSDLVEQLYADIKGKYDWIQKIEHENQQLKGECTKELEKLTKAETQMNQFKWENEQTKKELNQVYQSKRWRYTEKLSQIFHPRKEKQ